MLPFADGSFRRAEFSGVEHREPATMSGMSIISVDRRDDFRDNDVVLLAMDDAGLFEVLKAIREAMSSGGPSYLQGALRHELRIEAGRSDLLLTESGVTWCFSEPKYAEVVSKLEAMVAFGRASHQYVDIAAPVPTLVLSVNEYV